MESVKMKKATKTVAFRQLAIYCNIVDNQLLTRCRKYKLICNILIFSMLFPIIYMKRDKLGTKFIQK